MLYEVITNWAVINGDTETGITTFFLQHEIDTGEVIQQVSVPIEETDNVGTVHDKLMVLGGKLVIETVDAILQGTVKAMPQDKMAVQGELRPAPKIFKDTCRINWRQSVITSYSIHYTKLYELESRFIQMAGTDDAFNPIRGTDEFQNLMRDYKNKS